MKPCVLHLVDSFRQGGTERQAVQLVRLLCESGEYRVRVACLSGEGTLRPEVEGLGLGEIPEFSLKSFYDRNAVKQLRRLVHFLRAEEVELIHAHDFYTNIFGMTAAKLARTRARLASRRETGGMRSRAQKVTERFAYRLAHAILANGEAVREQLISEGVSATKIVTIYNGLDTARIRPSINADRDELLALFDLPRGRRFVTIVANLRHTVKDHPTFLRAAERVRARVPDAAFVLAGEGELTDSLRAYAAQLGLGDSAFFIGRCARVADLLALSEVCVLSSRAEGFSNAILEYMAAGRAVVSTDVGGAREAVVDGETGYLVAAGDDEAMAAHIIHLLEEPERARLMGERGRLRVEQEFSCAAQLERTLRLYERLLARRPVAALNEGMESLRGSES
ncbi:MAG: glycosyltransferase [Acidobacteriota bacterium]|nr:glycosyltransferase [Acidobacteriota bacterium]